MRFILFSIVLVACVYAQSGEDQSSVSDRPAPVEQKQGRGAVREIGRGAGNVGTGIAKVAGHVAKGTANGAVSLVTLHPIDAGVSVGKGAAAAGKDVTVGTVKGAAKITKGVGKAIKKVL